MKKLYFGIGSNDHSSYKFFNRGIYETPEDVELKIGKPIEK